MNIGELILRQELPYPYNLAEALTAATTVRHSENCTTYVEITPAAAERIVEDLSTDRLRDVVLRVAKHGESVGEIANAYCVTRNRIQQLEVKAAADMLYMARHGNYAVVPADEYSREVKARAIAEARLDALLRLTGEPAVVEQDDFPARQIRESDMSLRSINCLARAGMITFADVLAITDEKDFRNIRNLGPKSFGEIVAYVHANGHIMGWEAEPCT